MKTSKIKAWTKKNFDILAIVAGIALGLITGIILKSIFTNISPLALTYIGLPGQLIIRSIKLLIVPLLIASLSTSIISSKGGQNKRLIALTFISIVVSLIIVTIFGISLMQILRPGVRAEKGVRGTTESNVDVKKIITSQDEAIYDVLLNLVPDNIVGVAIMSHYTAVVPINPNNLTMGYKKVAEKSFKPNILGLCAFSLVLGFALLHLGDKALNIKKLLIETNSLVFTLVLVFVKLMPLGMFSWMCVEAIKMKSPETVMANLGWFMIVFFSAIVGIWFLLWPICYFILVRENLYKVYYNIIEAILIAVGSASSALTLPTTMKNMEENNNLPEPISHFVLPLGMTLHMPGTAMYYPMVAIFVAQMHGTPVTFAMCFTLLIYSVFQAMSLPGNPSGGSNLVFFVSTCAIIGIDEPMDVLAYTMAIEWIADRCRTPTNIVGDCVIAMIVKKYCHKNDNEINKIEEIEIQTINSSID